MSTRTVSEGTMVPHEDVDVEKKEEEEAVSSKLATPDFPEGGWMAWGVVLGSWLGMFVTFGYANAFGVFQSYYQFEGYPEESASAISWVGSIQLFLQFSMGAVAGPLYDKGYFRYLLTSGSIIYIVCLFMVSLCEKFWQVMLSQAIGIGLGVGLMFLPIVSVVSQYFLKRRSLAIGIATTGSSAGGIILPIMLNNLIASHGFRKAVQYTSCLLLGCVILCNVLLRTRLPPNPNAPPKPSPKKIFSDLSYTLLTLGLFAVSWGLFFPVFYLQVFAREKDLGSTLQNYTLAILNAASVVGRITPNFLADYFGPLNLLTIMCTGSGILCFAVFGADTQAGLVCVAIFFGFFQGAYVSLVSPALIATAKGFHEIGIRIGLGFLLTSFSTLTGTPITGALLDKYGFYAPIVWSGVTVLTGSALLAASRWCQAREKRTWKV